MKIVEPSDTSNFRKGKFKSMIFGILSGSIGGKQLQLNQVHSQTCYICYHYVYDSEKN